MLPAIIISSVIVLIAALCLFLFAPKKPDETQKKEFYGRNFAHRGLFTADQTVPENSLPAFQRAVDAGYGVELDVQLSADGRVVVFHDDTLDRACGVASGVGDLTFDELRTLKLFGTAELIPDFESVLSVLGGKVPVIVELKNGKKNDELCEQTLKMLSGYDGAYCVESFSPFIVGWFRKNARGVLRGQLSQLPRDYAGAVPKPAAALLGACFFNFIARPNFIAHRSGKTTLPVRLAYALGAMRVSWTAHGREEEEYSDAVIFEHFSPDIRFR